LNLQQFLNSDAGTRFWMALGRALPPGIAHPLVRGVAGILARRHHAPLYRTIYDNQAHVLGAEASPEQVNAQVRAVFLHGGLVSYDLVQILASGREAAADALDFTPETWRHIETARAGGRGVVVCGLHLSAFNLGMLTFSLRGFPVQILSRAQPQGGFRIMQELRDQGLLVETPIDGPSLRQAIVRLRQGGVVGTAADWPLAADPEIRLLFFGAPALLPIGHIRLALSTNAALLPIAARWAPDRGYYSISTPPLELERTGDRERDVVHNARRVLAIAEDWIREQPDQWLMYYPVWPENACLPEPSPATS
jgi:KDO2-lipid IV(A) lauroyltransferase